jgi:hypothetical protein
LESQIEERGPRRFEIRPDFTQSADDTFIGAAGWVDLDGVPHERHYVLTVRDDKIADLQVCGSRRQAMRFARRLGS